MWVKTLLSMGTGKSFSVKDDDWIIITFIFSPWRRPYLSKVEKNWNWHRHTSERLITAITTIQLLIGMWFSGCTCLCCKVAQCQTSHGYHCKRRHFRREFNFVAFVYLKKVRINFHTKFCSTWVTGLSIVTSCFYIFSQSESTKLNSVRKVLGRKVRNFSPEKISSFTVFSWFEGPSPKRMMMKVFETSPRSSLLTLSLNFTCCAALHVCVLPQSKFHKAGVSCRRSRLIQRNWLNFSSLTTG